MSPAKCKRQMEEVFYFSADGSWKHAYSRDSSPVSSKPELLFMAATQLMSFSTTPTSMLAKDGKQIHIYPADNDTMFIYVTDVSYPEEAIQGLLRSQLYLSQAFMGSFIRPVHVEGVHIHNIFGVPRVYAHQENMTTRHVLSDLTAAISSPLCALYSQKMIILATDDFWKMSKRDLHVIDLLVRHNEAPFSDQLFQRQNGRTDRVVVFHIYKSLKFVCVVGAGFNAMQAASTTLPSALWPRHDFLRLLEPAPPIVDYQDGLIAWIIVDQATPRFFGKVPEEMEPEFMKLICKAHEIADNNRVTDITLRLKENVFFYMPKVYVKKSFFYNQPHLWDFYCIHNMPKNVEQMRKFAMDTMLTLFQYVKPVNPVVIPAKGEGV